MKLRKTTSWTSLAISAWLCGCAIDFDSFQAKRSADRDSTTHGSMSDAGVGDAARSRSTESGMDADAVDLAPVTDAAVRDADPDDPRDDTSVDGGTGSDPGTSCEPLERRCNDDTVEACKSGGDGWKVRTRCGAAMCNPVSLACYACETELADDGVLACAAAHSAASGSAIAEVDTELAADDSAGSCGGAGSSEAVVEWIAPASDYFVLDTQGSDFDTVLYARDCACDGAELACNNNASQSDAYSEIVGHFGKGQRIALVVDGNAGSSGHAVINANPVTCPAFDLPLASLPATLIDEDHDGSENMRFTPTEDGFYSIRVRAQSSVRACLLDGPRCGGPEIACNTSNDAYGAQIIRELVAGRPLTLAVTLMSGDTSFDLSIDKLPGATCEDLSVFDSPPPSPTDGTLTDTSHNFLTPSCAPAGIMNPNNSSEVPAPEARFVFATRAQDVAPTVYAVSIDSDDPVVVYLLRDGCGGPEIACNIGAFNSNTNKYQAAVDIPGTGVATSYVIAIERGNVIPPRSPFKFSYIMSVLQ